jgi:hypothetical protein
MIEVGSEVICVNDDQPPQSDSPFVIKGRTYTVARIEDKDWLVGEQGPFMFFQRITMIWVEGLPSQTGHFGFRFRKVEKKTEEQKTDISVFTKMLDKQPEKVK